MEAMEKKKNESGALGKAIVLVGALCVVALVLVIVCYFATSSPRFTPPEFDPTAQEGIPTPPDDLGYGSLWQEGMQFKMSVCGVFRVEDGSADVYFTNTSDAAWLRLRVQDEEGNILGETGLVRENMYVQSLTLTAPVEEGQLVTMKVMAYEPDTYMSLGAVHLQTMASVPK